MPNFATVMNYALWHWAVIYGNYFLTLYFSSLATFFTLSTQISLPHIDNASFHQHKQMHTSDSTNECTYETHIQTKYF